MGTAHNSHFLGKLGEVVAAAIQGQKAEAEKNYCTLGVPLSQAA